MQQAEQVVGSLRSFTLTLGLINLFIVGLNYATLVCFFLSQNMRYMYKYMLMYVCVKHS